MIAPLGRDERIRWELGYPGPKNYIPRGSLPAYLKLRLRRKLTGASIDRELSRISYHTHITATRARAARRIVARSSHGHGQRRS